ncbi:MAG: hypothetical protein H8D45_10995 [Bacteroidetes bacterium]|nr:hypothetical protein [Bacteroidota bacterium]
MWKLLEISGYSIYCEWENKSNYILVFVNMRTRKETAVDIGFYPNVKLLQEMVTCLAVYGYIRDELLVKPDIEPTEYRDQCFGGLQNT